MKKILTLSTFIVLLSGCATDYPCGEPRIGKCSNVTMNYNASLQGVVNPDDLPVNGSTNPSCGLRCKSLKANKSITEYVQKSKYPQIPENGSPLLSTPSMMRVWYTPYIDSDNIYHDQEYQYMVVDRGHWLYGSNSIYGRNSPTLTGATTKLIQSTNDNVIQDNPNQDQNAHKTAQASIANQPNNTPALDFLRQQDVGTTTSMGLGK
jgi:type IV conjugative transfer system lipoprotein TraV